MRILLAFCFAIAAHFCLIGQTASHPQIVAHRGHWKAANGAQNSLESLARADSVGAYASEFDVWLTIDNHLVVNHDRTFKGVNFTTAPYDSIRALVLANGEQLPTLEEYLQEALRHPDLRLVLEQKPLPNLAREDRAAAMIVELLRYYGLMDRTDIISFSINACLAYKKLVPEGLPIYYLDGDLRPKKIASLGLAGIDYNGRTLKAHPEWVQEAHDLGLKVNVWTIDDPADKLYFAEQGVDFITTNEP